MSTHAGKSMMRDLFFTECGTSGATTAKEDWCNVRNSLKPWNLVNADIFQCICCADYYNWWNNYILKKQQLFKIY